MENHCLLDQAIIPEHLVVFSLAAFDMDDPESYVSDVIIGEYVRQ